ncbi:hypothetical protein BCR34DRAFT_596195 [Clohesyomyces aquaticus]|uniref:Uncharacterized protein n=1 Tax=Clohesyomyces aquaticus TaxID=1231657 RepID=A0A1Y2A7X1_9PLEO|nr:hypothetical protein BCR34DRAFT_596195 [Clohesyomyces aquaticus]
MSSSNGTSEWVWEDGELGPVVRRSPSPSPPPVSADRYQFEMRLLSASNRDLSDSPFVDPHAIPFIQSAFFLQGIRPHGRRLDSKFIIAVNNLDDRLNFTGRSNKLRASGAPYELPMPLNLDMQMLFVDYPELLDRYYMHEDEIWQAVQQRFEQFRAGQVDWDANPDLARELTHLYEHQKAHEDNIKAEIDEKVLGAYLEGLEKKVLGALDLEGMVALVAITTNLPPHVRKRIEAIPKLSLILRGLRDIEEGIKMSRANANELVGVVGQTARTAHHNARNLMTVEKEEKNKQEKTKQKQDKA